MCYIQETAPKLVIICIRYSSYVEEQSQLQVLLTWKYNPRWTISLLLRERERRAIRAASPFPIDRNYIVPWFPNDCPHNTSWKMSRNTQTLSFKGPASGSYKARHGMRRRRAAVGGLTSYFGWLVCLLADGGMDGLLVASPLSSFLAVLRLEPEPDADAAPEIQFIVGGPEPELPHVYQ